MADKTDCFAGDRRQAITRLRRLVKLAIENLPTSKLNLASYHLAVYLDYHAFHAALAAGRKVDLDHARTNLMQFSEELDHGSPGPAGSAPHTTPRRPA